MRPNAPLLAALALPLAALVVGDAAAQQASSPDNPTSGTWPRRSATRPR